MMRIDDICDIHVLTKLQKNYLLEKELFETKAGTFKTNFD